MINLVNKDNRNTNNKPGFHYVICLIEVWKPKGVFDYGYTEDVTRLTELSSMKCDESYTQMLGTMDLSFTKGTVLRKTIANETESREAYSEIKISKEEDGVVQVLKSNVKLATVGDFSPGNRIKVYAGYTTDRKIADLGRVDLPIEQTIFGPDKSKLNTYKKAMGGAPVFDGFIVKCSDKTPITLSCESLASSLKKISIKQKSSTGMKLSEILDYLKLTEKTGLSLHSSIESEANDIELPVSFREGMNMLDVFSSYLKQYKLYARIEWDAKKNKYALRIGYSFTSGVVDNSSSDPCIYDGDQATVIYSDYDVASDSLKSENVDMYYLAVKVHATIIESKGKKTRFSFCMRLDPDKINSDKPTYEFKYFNKKALTKNERQNIRKLGKSEVDTSSLKVIERTYPVSIPRASYDFKKLQQWGAIQFYDAMKNGISGSLTLFGGLNMVSGMLVCFIDTRYANRSGVYLVEKVSTTLSTNGLRQEITIPYKLAGAESEVSKIQKELEDARK